MESGRTTRRKRTVLLILMSRALEICLAMLLATFPVQEGNRGRERGVGIGQKEREREREFKIEIDTFVSLTLSSFVVNPFCVPSATRQDKECECESECECVGAYERTL